MPDGAMRKGRLVRTVVAYPEMKPHRLIPEGRGDDPRDHSRALFRLDQFRMGDAYPVGGTLPVAALPVRPGEDLLVHRGKMRPCVVISTGGVIVDAQLRAGSQRWQSNPAVLLAPYYGADADGTRVGWPAEFVDRIRHCEYPQYAWDRLPIGGVQNSILRLDNLFVVGADPSNYELQPFGLLDEAIRVLDEQVQWLVTNNLPDDSLLASARQILHAL